MLLFKEKESSHHPLGKEGYSVKLMGFSWNKIVQYQQLISSYCEKQEKNHHFTCLNLNSIIESI